jgi:hypothetical protein
MFNKKTLWIVGVIAALLLSNYSTFWATNKLNEVQVLEERIKAMDAVSNSLESELLGLKSVLNDPVEK